MDSKIYKLENDFGLEVEFMALGGRINSVRVPSDFGIYDLVVGYHTVEQAAKGDEYLGAICGRVANRISGGKFELEGKTYQLAQNIGNDALHGGPYGFHKKEWKVEKTEKEGCCCAYKLSMTSEDGDENYPGELKVEMIYSLNNNHEFEIDIKATTDKTTIVNLTAHPYFNANGVGFNHRNIMEQELTVNAKEFTPLGENSIPTGEIRSVEGTPMDLRKGVLIKDIVNSSYEQIKQVGGIDHNWIIDKEPGEMGFAMRLYSYDTRMSVEMHTTQPGVQIYGGMHFNGEKVKYTDNLQAFDALAVEAQNFPDAINHSNFPSPVLKPGETYHERIMYRIKYV